MLYFSDYKSVDRVVEAAQWESVEDIGDLVQQLYDVGCNFITATYVLENPQLEESSHIPSISFFQDGVSQTAFLGDYIVFTEDEQAFVYTEEEFERQFEEII